MINMLLNEGTSTGSNWVILVVFLVVLVFMVLSMIRGSKAEKARAAAYEEMKERLKVGDEVQTIGGILGTIVQINKKGERKSVVIKSAGTEIEFLIDAIGGVVEDPNAVTSAEKEEISESEKEDVAEAVEKEEAKEQKAEKSKNNKKKK